MGKGSWSNWAAFFQHANLSKWMSGRSTFSGEKGQPGERIIIDKVNDRKYGKREKARQSFDQGYSIKPGNDY